MLFRSKEMWYSYRKDASRPINLCLGSRFRCANIRRPSAKLFETPSCAPRGVEDIFEASSCFLSSYSLFLSLIHTRRVSPAHSFSFELSFRFAVQGTRVPFFSSWTEKPRFHSFEQFSISISRHISRRLQKRCVPQLWLQ